MKKVNKNDYWYPLKVWLLDLALLAPIALTILLLFNGDSIFDDEYFFFILLSTTMSLLYSLPTLALFYIIYLVSLRQQRNPKSIKIIACGLTLASLMLTMILLFENDATRFVVVYSISTILAFLIVPLRVKQIATPNIPAMDNTLKLQPGQLYEVVKTFTDYDRVVHETGERWIYQGTHFLPYEDGLTLHVLIDGRAIVYRLQWREEEQGAIIDHFADYVRAVDGTL